MIEAVNQQRAQVMTDTITIQEAILNGIRYLKEEEMFGRGEIRTQAARNLRIAMLRGNDRAARYWRKVLVTIRRLEQTRTQAGIRIAA